MDPSLGPESPTRTQGGPQQDRPGWWQKGALIRAHTGWHKSGHLTAPHQDRLNDLGWSHHQHKVSCSQQLLQGVCWPPDTSGQHLAHGPAAQTMRAGRSTLVWNDDGHQGQGTEAHSPLRRTGPPPCYLAVSPSPIHHSVLQGAFTSTDWGWGSQHRKQNPGVWEAHHHPCLLAGSFFSFPFWPC